MRDVKPSLTRGHRLWFPLDPSCHHPVLYSASPSLPPLFSGSHQLSISTLSGAITHDGEVSRSMCSTFRVFYYISPASSMSYLGNMKLNSGRSDDIDKNSHGDSRLYTELKRVAEVYRKTQAYPLRRQK